MNRKGFLKKAAKGIAALLVFLILLWLLRKPLMRMTGNVLICENELQQTEAIFVLSGNPEARSAEAARLLRSAWAPRIVCTGENIPDLFDAFDIEINEAELSRERLLEEGVPSHRIELLPLGTSTREESNYILEYCKLKGLRKITVLSDKFHTRRMDYAFRDDFEKAGITLVLRGAPATSYSESLWWAEESGILMVNNEYVKLFYYYLKY